MAQLESSRDSLVYGWRKTTHEWESTRQEWSDRQTAYFDQHHIEPVGEQHRRTVHALEHLIEAVNAARRDI